jgi:predicted outer membrane protein
MAAGDAALPGAAEVHLFSIKEISMLRRSGIAGWVVLTLATGQLAAQDQQRAGQQQGSQSTQQQSTQQSSTLQSSQSNQGQHGKLDSAVAKWLIAMNEAEIQLSQFGQQQAENSQVKDFAAKMVQDHRQLVEQLRQIAGDSQSISGSQSSQSTSRSRESISGSGQATSGSSHSTRESNQSTRGSQSSQSTDGTQSRQSLQDPSASSQSPQGGSSSSSGQSLSSQEQASESQASEDQPSRRDPSSSLGQSSQDHAPFSPDRPSQELSSSQGQSSATQTDPSQSAQRQQSRSSTAQSRGTHVSEGGIETRSYRGETSFGSSGGELHQVLQLQEQIESKVVETLKKGLQDKQGSQFDQTFMGLQLLAHMRMLDTLDVMQQHASGQLRQTLQDAQQATQQHLQMAEQLKKTLETSVASERTPQRQ